MPLATFVIITWFLHYQCGEPIHSFIHSGDLYSASSRDYYSEALPAQSRTKRRTSERCKIWKGGPSARNAAQREDHFMLMDLQPKGPSLHNSQTGPRDQKLASRSRTQHPTCGQNQHWAAEIT